MPSFEAIHRQSELDPGRIKSSHREIPAFECRGDLDVHLVATACPREIGSFLPAKRVRVNVCKENQIGQPEPFIRERSSGEL